MDTTIQISKRLQKELLKRKLYDKETYEEIIWDIMEDTMELNEQTKKEIAEAYSKGLPIVEVFPKYKNEFLNVFNKIKEGL